MYGLNIDILNPHGNPPGSELAHLGVEFARFTYHDPTPGPGLEPGMVDLYSRKVQELRDSGIDTLLILTYDTLPGKPAYDASASEWGAYIDRFTQRVGQIAGIFGPKGAALQIWNEPDLAPAPGYEPSLRPEIYAMMLDKACKAVLSASYHTAIVSAGLASGDPAWWQKVYMGTIQPIDVLAIHPYGQRPAPDFPHPGWGFGDVGDLIEAYKSVWGGKIWITEIGESTPNQAEQAEYLRRFYSTIRGDYEPPVSEVFWFCYGDGMVSPYGLRDAGGFEKPAYAAYRQVSGVTP